MELLRRRAYARAGLIGNPSDGYNGRTLSITVRNFFADVVLYEWPTVEIVRSEDDHSRFDSIHELIRDVELHGYYGGIRLVNITKVNSLLAGASTANSPVPGLQPIEARR